MMSRVLRESKSAATIRRRRKKKPSECDNGISFRHKSHNLDDNFDFTEEDPDAEMEAPNMMPQVLRLILSSEKTLFLGLLAFRVVNALVIQTAFVPDEYWQSLEVAHQMAYGYGYKTWEWRHGLRGYLYPSVFAALFKFLGLVHLDSRLLLIKLPRMMQGLLSAVGDLYLYKLSLRLAGPNVALWSLFCQLTSWFAFFCGPRTLTNSVETVLTTVALYYYPWPGKTRKAHWKYISLVGVAVVIRPTAAIVWLPLCVWHLWLYRQAAWKVIKIFAEKGFIIFSISSIIDRCFYGDWINVHYNFLEFNVLHNMGAFYGSHPWHWYLTQGFAVILGTHIFPFLMGARKAMERVFLAVILWTIFVYSLLTHKEFRFLYPLLPMAMHICGKYLHYSTEVVVQEEEEEGGSEVEAEDEQEETSPLESDEATRKSMQNRKLFCIVFLIVTNLPLAMYTSLLHQRGTIEVMKYLHDEAKAQPDMNVMFLMPCHSTPHYSYIHHNISLRFLTCEPNLDQEPNYVDEADVFYSNPQTWLASEYTGKKVPSHLVMFNSMESEIAHFLQDHGYRECKKLFHTHLPEGRVGSHVMVWCQQTRRQRRRPIFSGGL